jgi:hypothetical protein
MTLDRFVFGAVLTVFLFLFLDGPGLPRRVRAAESQAFSVTQQDILRCSNNQVAATLTEARLPDGSRSTVTQRPDGYTEKFIRRADGTMVRAYDHVGAKSTVRVSEEVALGRELDPEANCIKTISGGRIVDAAAVGREVMNGVETVKVVTTGGAVRITAWHAPSLACLPLRRLHEERNQAGVWKEVSLLETLRIDRGTPSLALFESQGDEMSPSAAVERVERRRLKNAQMSRDALEERVQKAKRSVANQDRNYEQFHPRYPGEDTRR